MGSEEIKAAHYSLPTAHVHGFRALLPGDSEFHADTIADIIWSGKSIQQIAIEALTAPTARN
jgi:hypothetical protein